MMGISKSRASVHDPFDHAQSLMKNEAEIEFAKKNYGKLINQRAMLSNIGDDHLMLLNQNSVSLVVAAYELACRDSEFIPVFEFMYHSWTGGLTMTRAKDGKERDQQANAGSGTAPQGEYGGFGEGLPYGEQAQPPQENWGDKIRGAIPKTKEPPKRV
jgi:hypothetical protein